MVKRINVSSGRSLEKQAHYSRALRVGDTVLQAGTTAIDREGNVIGEGDVAKQVDAIMKLAEWSMGQAGGRLEDVVRSRIYLTDISLTEPAALAVAAYFKDIRPAATLVQVSRLARPTQLVEIELEAIDGAKDRAQRVSSGRDVEDQYAYSRAVRVDDRVFISGTTALSPTGTVAGPDDMYTQARQTFDTMLSALDQLGGRPADLMNTKTFVTGLSQTEGYWRAQREALAGICPTATLLAIPALIHPQMMIEIESDARLGSAAHRREIFSVTDREKTLGYARAVEVGDWVYVSGSTALDEGGTPQALGDWAAQNDLSHQTIQRALEQAGASLDDVVSRRIFTVDGAQQNRTYGDGPAWFAASCPVSMGCRVSALAHPDLLVEVEAIAMKGAHADIDWVEASPNDPLSG